MNQQEIGVRLAELTQGKQYLGELGTCTVKSILSGTANYPASNLLQYCKDMKIDLILEDVMTGDRFKATTILEVHKVLGLLMDRWDIRLVDVFRQTGMHYTPPTKDSTSLSIKTFLAVCEAIHCNLLLET